MPRQALKHIDIPIITFQSICKQVLWGGTKIASFKGLGPGLSNIGECWELSALPGRQTVALTPPFTGLLIGDILASYAKEILGERLAARYGGTFPLLVKFIDAHDNLSVQVHPDDQLAARRHKCSGKTEMWVTLDCSPEATLYAGFARQIHAEEIRKHIAEGTLLNYLRSYTTHKGDVFFIPAGCVHSLGKGNLVLEIHQTSDITYRLYDYGRQRQLHIDDAIIALDYSTTPYPVHSIDFDNSAEVTIAGCPYFTATTLAVDCTRRLNLDKRDSFTILINIGGEASVTAPDGLKTPLPQGGTALIPATMPYVDINGAARLVTVYID